VVGIGYLEGALNFTIKIPVKRELDVWMYLVGSYKLNVVVFIGYLKGDLNFTTKIPIKPEYGMWICLVGYCKSNILA